MTISAAVTFDGSSANEFSLQFNETPYTLPITNVALHTMSVLALPKVMSGLFISKTLCAERSLAACNGLII
jgi:hypothetical protein